MFRAAFTVIDHVQLAMPPGEEQKARNFFVGVLGMEELPKPESLAKRGGVWFQSGLVQIHLGVEADFRAAKKAHPALRCSNYPELLHDLRDKGIRVVEDAEIAGVQRCYVDDPFGNRIEIIAAE